MRALEYRMQCVRSQGEHGNTGGLESRGGKRGGQGDERRLWLAALLAATSSAFANHCVVGKERRWP